MGEKPQGPWTDVCWKARPGHPARPRKTRNYRHTEYFCGEHGRTLELQATDPSSRYSPLTAHPCSSHRTGGSRHQATEERGVTQELWDGPFVPDSGSSPALMHGSEARRKEEGGAAERNRLSVGTNTPSTPETLQWLPTSGEV